MNLEETEKLLIIQKRLYPNYGKDFDEETFELQARMWQRAFNAFSFEECAIALEMWYNKEIYPPLPANFKPYVLKIAKTSTAESPQKAWETVDTAVRRFGSYGKDKAFATFSDSTKRAVLNIGGWQRICETQLGQPWDFLRKNFIEAYQDFDQERQDLDLLPSPVLKRLFAQQEQAKIGDGS